VRRQGVSKFTISTGTEAMPLTLQQVEMTRRDIDDEPLAGAAPDFLQLCSQHLQMPILLEFRLRV